MSTKEVRNATETFIFLASIAKQITFYIHNNRAVEWKKNLSLFAELPNEVNKFGGYKNSILKNIIKPLINIFINICAYNYVEFADNNYDLKFLN